MTSLDVGAMVTAAVTLAASHPDRAAGVALTIDVDPDAPSLDGDEDLLHRAIFNLVLNAIQAVGTEGGCRSACSARRARTTYRLPGSALTVDGPLIAISVTDDGVGIPADLRERLFEPFVTSKPGGSGLGLAGRAPRHRGAPRRRARRCAAGHGTRFTVILPRTFLRPGVAA